MKARILRGVLLLTGLLPAFTAWAADGDFAWARGMGGPKYDHVTSMALDDNSNIYVAGFFRGVMDADPGPGVFELHAEAESKDGSFLLKLDNAGNLLWAVAIGDSRGYIVSDVAVDGPGNVYATGGFSGTVDFDPGPGIFELTKQNGAGFVWKLDPSGNFLWAKASTGSTPFGGNAIARDREGNVYTIGSALLNVEYGTDPKAFEMATVTSAHVTCISKLDANGNFVWAKAQDSTYMIEEPHDIVVDDAGYVHTTGAFGETMDFDPGPEVFELKATGRLGTYVSTLDKDGNFVRAFEFGEGYGQCVTVDNAGNLYILGMFHGTVDFDPGPSTFTLTASDASAGFDIFVSKLDREGKLVWAIPIGGDDEEEALDFVLDTSNNLYITGKYNGSIDFDPGPGTAVLTFQTNVSWSGTFLLKLDAIGHLTWVKQIEVTGGQRITVDRMEHTYTAGQSFGLDIKTGTRDFYTHSEGGADVVIIKRYGPQPIVTSIAPARSTLTEGGLLPFKVTFSTEVTGVDTTDFRLTATDTLSTSQIINVEGIGKDYTVMVAVSAGDGTLRVDLVDDDSITDITGTPIGGLGKGNADYIVGDIHFVPPVLPIRQMLLQSLLSLAIFPGGIVLLIVVASYVLRRIDRRRRKKQ